MTSSSVEDPHALADPYFVAPLAAPPDAVIVLPGSKSLTNRALVAAALAPGESRVRGVLLADDTEAMIDAIGVLGARTLVDPQRHEVLMTGVDGRPHGGSSAAEPARVDVRESGTTARFVVPLGALAEGPVHVDAAPAMRVRPMASLFEALTELGLTVTHPGEAAALPCVLSGGPIGGGTVAVRGDESSQFLSGLLLAAPAMAHGLTLRLVADLVSRPYVTMTRRVMAAFGVRVEEVGERELRVDPQTYESRDFEVEPDASAASYFFAAAAVTGGRVRIDGLGASSLQGDLRFVDILERMGARVSRTRNSIEVVGTGELRGVEVDLADLSDTAPTLAVTAPFASTPTRVRGIGFIRAKESDRIGSVVTELHRCGIRAEETSDGFVVHPGTPNLAVIETYGDHRLAMSFAVLGLAAQGVHLVNPGCVAKTFPSFFAAVDRLRTGGPGGGGATAQK